MIHFPPLAAVLRVSQLTTSPDSSLWNVWMQWEHGKHWFIVLLAQ